MSRQIATAEDKLDLQVQENVTNWQAAENPLAPLTEEQLDLIYQIGDLIKSDSVKTDTDEDKAKSEPQMGMPIINSNRALIDCMLALETDIREEGLRDYQIYYDTLCEQASNCQHLFEHANETSDLLQELRKKYLEVTSKTDSLHSLSEQLMTHQRLLKEKKKSINERLKYFLMFKSTQDGIDRLSSRVNTKEYTELLDNIDDAIAYLGKHMNFKESRVYKMKYESLLATALEKVYKVVSSVIADATRQVVDPESKTHLLPLNVNVQVDSIDPVFSLYYGKFQSVASKIRLIIAHLEEKVEKAHQYESAVVDCQKFYISQRLPVLSMAVSKALQELKDRHKGDFSVLFRACGLFVMKTCQDEASCYHYFFSRYSTEINDYLGVLCQHLYDTLRPSLITVNHVEVLSELCGILQREMLSDKVLTNDQLAKYVEVIRQLLQDVEERLVFRTNIFFQHDLLGYNPSPGDLAYPEKLEQMENIALELHDSRANSRASSVSLESQEVSGITTPSQQHHLFRSYTGNSPADLHGMWYPTVKRTLVVLSRLYFCLDRETFQGLAQEALLICISTVHRASDLISGKKSEIDGRLFQIKHLLIIREQIAPFQVDFTVKELSLDFSSVQKAAMELLQKRDRLFTFGSNNALLEFLLEGTPKVREYLVDSRKEIDKELKHACEAFIMYATSLLAGGVQRWIKMAEAFLQNATTLPTPDNANAPTLPQQDFAKAKAVSEIISETLKNLKLKIPEVQRSMQLYLANRETEFILFRPIKNNVINVFVQVDHILTTAKYSSEELLLIGCPSPEQVNVLMCSVSLASEQDYMVVKPGQ